MQQQNMNLNIDLSKTTPVLTPDGGQIWQPGYILRKVSRFIVGGNDDAIIPIQVFYDPKTGTINREGLPKELDFLFEDESEN